MSKLRLAVKGETTIHPEMIFETPITTDNGNVLFRATDAHGCNMVVFEMTQKGLILHSGLPLSSGWPIERGQIRIIR